MEKNSYIFSVINLIKNKVKKCKKMLAKLKHIW